MELTKNRKVEISLIGSDGDLSVVGVFQIIQDAVTDLLGRNELSAPVLRNKYNAIWLFVKTKAIFTDCLSGMDEFTVNAFVSYVSLAKLHIDVKITTTDGKTVMHSRTELCALDIEKQGIRRLPTVGVDVNMPILRDEANIEFTRFEDGELPIVETVRVRSTCIDMSHHTNNTEYVRMIMNTYTTAQTEAMNINTMELFYTGQSYEDNLLTIRKAVTNNEHRIVLEKDGKAVIKCKISCEK